ncbi:ABC transporter permease [Microbacterium halophytorum]|uniref:ABC transporter permease n=1 Tax=Microbacterium halophytorum TaxID=2067568 RepID=UPI000CFC7A29|nr:ABC transporter permease [Microbacterium halophytorum]
MPAEQSTAARSAGERGRRSADPKGDVDALAAGLDRLQSDDALRTPAWRGVLAKALPPVVLLVALLAAWQLYVVIAQPRPDISPGPLRVLGALGDAWGQGRLQEALLTSLERGIIGFVIAIVVGTPLGLLLAEWRWLRRAAGPLISGLQVLPSVAWVPAAIIWFGLSDATVYFVILMGAIPSIINGLLSGIDQVPPQLRRAGVVLGASRWQLASAVVLPAALPGYVAGLKQGWAFSWRSLMAAEIIAVGGSIGFGLGSMLQQSRELADLAGVLGTILLILAIGVLIELLVFGPLERRLLRGRGLAQGDGR